MRRQPVGHWPQPVRQRGTPSRRRAPCRCRLRTDGRRRCCTSRPAAPGLDYHLQVVDGQRFAVDRVERHRIPSSPAESGGRGRCRKTAAVKAEFELLLVHGRGRGSMPGATASVFATGTELPPPQSKLRGLVPLAPLEDATPPPSPLNVAGAGNTRFMTVGVNAVPFFKVYGALDSARSSSLEGAVPRLLRGVRRVTEITLPRAKRPKRWETGCARVQLTTLYRSLS